MPGGRALRDQIWLKLIGNVAFNSVTALTRATLGELGTLPEMERLLRAMLEESAAVAARLDVELPVSIERAPRPASPSATTRLHASGPRGRKPLELDCMSGAVIELAERLDVPVPHIFTAASREAGSTSSLVASRAPSRPR